MSQELNRDLEHVTVTPIKTLDDIYNSRKDQEYSTSLDKTISRGTFSETMINDNKDPKNVKYWQGKFKKINTSLMTREWVTQDAQ